MWFHGQTGTNLLLHRTATYTSRPRFAFLVSGLSLLPGRLLSLPQVRAMSSLRILRIPICFLQRVSISTGCRRISPVSGISPVAISVTPAKSHSFPVPGSRLWVLGAYIGASGVAPAAIRWQLPGCRTMAHGARRVTVMLVTLLLSLYQACWRDC